MNLNQDKVDQGILELLFKQLRTGHWWLLPLVVMILFLIKDDIQPLPMMIWLGSLIIYLIISDVFLIRAYGRSKQEIKNYKNWFQSVALHNFFLGGIVAILPILCNQHSSQFTIILMTVLVCGLIIGSSAVLASYINAYISWSIPLSIGLIIFINEQNIPGSNIFKIFPVLTVFTGIFFASNARQLIVSSVTTNLKNEELVVQLKEKHKIAEQAAVDKSRFFASASHDLRQPLHALGLFVETLDLNLKNNLDRKLINNISQCTDALQALFDALLDISRLDAGVVSVEKKHFFCNEILTNIVSEFDAIAKEKGLQLYVQESDYVVFSDRILSERILRNLINNAIKYTSEGSIRVDVSHIEGCISIEITDTGIGINENEFDAVFQEFYQINNPERDQSKGLGLGLSIVKRLANLLSLELTLKKVEPHGTKFIVNFPTGEVGRIKQRTYSEKPNMNKFEGIHVLVIDDEVHILEGMKSMLGTWGFNVSLADSAESAEAIISKDKKPQLILSDLRLRGDATGLEAIKHVRDLMGCYIPALLISGDTDPEKIKEAQLAKIQLLHKPVKPAKLRVTINWLLQNQVSEVPPP